MVVIAWQPQNQPTATSQVTVHPYPGPALALVLAPARSQAIFHLPSDHRTASLRSAPTRAEVSQSVRTCLTFPSAPRKIMGTTWAIVVTSLLQCTHTYAHNAAAPHASLWGCNVFGNASGMNHKSIAFSERTKLVPQTLAFLRGGGLAVAPSQQPLAQRTTTRTRRKSVR